MKGSLLRKFFYLFCAVAGVSAGYGIVTLAGTKENIDSTKDNTLIRDIGDSVFFMEKNEKEKQPENLITPIQNSIMSEGTQEPTHSEPSSMEQRSMISELPFMTQKMTSSDPTLIPIITSTPNSTSQVELPETSVSTSSSTLTVTPIPKATITPTITKENAEISEDKLPSLGGQWVSIGQNVLQPTFPSVTPKQQENQTAEVITYPVQIFGQVPVINRSDTYVSYFEFAYDLAAMLEPIVEARGLNMNSLLTQFVMKALFCGVDIEKLDINAPIPRRLAALCLWLAAQVLNESGYETSAKSAESYVKDIAFCSVSEKKAIAYLYESGIVKGYQISGQCFYPQEGLKTEIGTAWILTVNQRWK